MSKVIILKGLPASGKSTWAKEYMTSHLNTKRINKDLLRLMLDWNVWNHQNEKEVLKVRDTLLTNFLNSGYDVIIDDTNLAKKHETRIRQLVKKTAEVEVVSFLDVPIEECIQRDRERENSVGEKVIRNMYEQFVAPLTKEQRGKLWKERMEAERKMRELNPRPFDPSLDWAIIVDIDGTVALHVDRSPYDLEKCDTDEPYEAVVTLIQNFVRGWHGEPLSVLFVSGRDDSVEEKTREWLYTNVAYSWAGKDDIQLFMRKAGDSRKDVIIKREIFEEHIEGKFNVAFVLDDRNQTVQGFRELGLPCFQVAPGDF